MSALLKTICTSSPLDLFLVSHSIRYFQTQFFWISNAWVRFRVVRFRHGEFSQFVEIYWLSNESCLIWSYQFSTSDWKLFRGGIAPHVNANWFQDAFFRRIFRVKLSVILKINVGGSYYCNTAVFVVLLLDGIFVFQCSARRCIDVAQDQEVSDICLIEWNSDRKEPSWRHVLHSRAPVVG